MLSEVARGGLENTPVYRVVPNLDGIALQEAFTHQPRQPTRRRDKRHTLRRDAREDSALVLPVPPTGVQEERRGVAPLLRAVTAAGEPPVAANVLEMRAMARERPAIVQRPANLAAMPCQPPEQHLDVDVVSVDVVQVHDVGVDLVELLQQLRRVALRVEPGAVGQAGQGTVKIHARLRCATAFVIAYRLVPATPEDVRVDAALLEALMEAAHDRPGGAVVEAVDLNVAQRAAEALAERERLVHENVGGRGVVEAIRHSGFLHTILSTMPV